MVMRYLVRDGMVGLPCSREETLARVCVHHVGATAEASGIYGRCVCTTGTDVVICMLAEMSVRPPRPSYRSPCLNQCWHGQAIAKCPEIDSRPVRQRLNSIEQKSCPWVPISMQEEAGYVRSDVAAIDRMPHLSRQLIPSSR
jgi:hypothetical protein